jgi:hypothetical protein
MKQFIAQIRKEVLPANPGLTEILVAADGQVFRVNEMNQAVMHVKSIGQPLVWHANVDALEKFKVVYGGETNDPAEIAEDLKELTKAQLVERLQVLGKEVDTKLKKDELFELLVAALAEPLGTESEAPVVTDDNATAANSDTNSGESPDADNAE